MKIDIDTVNAAQLVLSRLDGLVELAEGEIIDRGGNRRLEALTHAMSAELGELNRLIREAWVASRGPAPRSTG